MEPEKRWIITPDTIASEIFKWIGFAWTGMSIVIVVQFLIRVSESKQVTGLEYQMTIYQNALEWAVVAIPAFLASYMGRR